MELNHLRHFHAVAKSGGFTKASKKLLIQQPALSKTVANLEEQLQAKLFIREKRKVSLTDIGEEIFQVCDRIFSDVERIEQIAHQEKLLCHGPLKFCAAEPIASHFIPPVHQSFLEHHPQVIPACFSGFAKELFEQIEEGEFEFGLFFHTPKLSSKLLLQKVYDVPFDIVIKSSEAQNLDIIRSFIGSREIDDTRTKTFPAITQMNKDYKGVEIRISSNSLTSHKNMVLQGLGVSILPEYMVREEIKHKKLKRLYPKNTFKFPLKLVHKKHSYLSRNARAWLETLRQLGAQ